MAKKKTTDAKPTAIALEATLTKISTTVDGGWCVTFEASESELANIMRLSEYREISLQLAIVPFTQN